MKDTTNLTETTDFNPELKGWFSPEEVGNAFNRSAERVRRLVILEQIRSEPKQDPSDKHEPVRIPSSEARRLLDTNFKLLPPNPDKMTRQSEPATSWWIDPREG